MSAAATNEPPGALSADLSEALSVRRYEQVMSKLSTEPQPTSPRLDAEMHVELVHGVASDDTVCQAARVSTQGAPQYQPPSVEAINRQEMRGLINYLMKNRHGSPFEHNQFCFKITAPIFVFREFHRHRVGWSYNEESARYRELEPHFWVPGPERKLAQIGKPGRYHLVPGTEEQQVISHGAMAKAYLVAWESYQSMLEAGVAREVARAVLPVATYSSMFATCNARSLMHFLSLRTHDESAQYVSHPQREIEQVAELMENHLSARMPVTYEAYQRNGRVAP